MMKSKTSVSDSMQKNFFKRNLHFLSLVYEAGCSFSYRYILSGIHKGDVVDTVTTDEDGTAKSKELYLGKYTVVETKAPTGMVINKEKHSVELTYAGQDVAVTETATSFLRRQ